MALTSDGTVYAWGNGLYGQLGNNAFESSVPVQVPNLSGITDIAAGVNHSLALKSDGTVYAWGDGQNGQLGDGNFYGPPPFRVVVPVQVASLSGVTAIAAGFSHSLALKSDGTVYAWGSGTSGQMGNGSFNSSAVPVPVSGVSRIKAIAAGRGHNLALNADGIVYAWGLGISGQLGSGGFNSGSLRVQVVNLSGITAIAAGNLHSLAIKSDGTVYAWGHGTDGQLGNGNFNNSAVPVQVSSLSNITDISGGEGHSLARKSDGIIYAWESGSCGQLGNGSFASSAVPVPVSGLKLDLPPSPGNDEKEAPILDWDKTLGGSDRDYLTSVQQTLDGGYIVGGYSLSNASGEKTENTKGSWDFWVVKLNAAGSKEWDKTFGGNLNDNLNEIQQTVDGGYILGGDSYSNAGGDKSENSKGGDDYWMIKLNAMGSKEWDKTIGGNSSEFLRSFQKTADGGYILGGISYSDAGGDKSEASNGGSDFWVVKINSSGSIEWENTIGGNGNDDLHSVQPTADGGYILGGESSSGASGDKSHSSLYNPDFWVVKLNSLGAIEWEKTIGGNSGDGLNPLLQSPDGGYILGGSSGSNAGGDKSENSKGGNDFWVVKLYADGTIAWDRTIGGISYDVLHSLQHTADGGYILGGNSNSNAGADKSENMKGHADF